MRAFISHATRDKLWARELGQHLEALGVQVWRDENEIFPGENWLLKTGEALAAADALLVLVSPASATSKYVHRELQFALGSPKFEDRVIPVIVEATDEMPWILSTFASVTGSPAEAAQQVAKILTLPSPRGSTAVANSR
jgi:hypothetical protein